MEDDVIVIRSSKRWKMRRRPIARIARWFMASSRNGHSLAVIDSRISDPARYDYIRSLYDDMYTLRIREDTDVQNSLGSIKLLTTKTLLSRTLPSTTFASSSRNPLLITSSGENNSMSTSYIRAVNDYTVSVHEQYTTQWNIAPHVSSIVTIKDGPYTQIDAIVKEVDEFLLTNGIVSVKSGDIKYYDDEVEQETYSIYRQYVGLYTDDNGICIGIEILGTPKLISITTIGNDTAFDQKLASFLTAEKAKHKLVTTARKDKTFYTISSGPHGFELEDLNIKSDFSKDILQYNYNDDFTRVDDVIIDAINEDKKGLILLHGEPGTGKTSYIKYLITGDSKRRIVYIPTHLTTSIASPSFISFVKSELSNSVLVIEDAEQVLLTRESGESHKEAVSNILNLTDGILADALNLLIICTFNTKMENIDKALLRKGRLLLEYKFSNLSLQKSNALSQKLYGKSVDVAMPLSDIYNLEYDLITPAEPKKLKFGFNPNG
jgi:ATPase family associated with various cellular activities (AAA)